MPVGKLYVGTSGWSYPHWARGRFYPPGLKPGDWLGFLAERFSTVEINASFYRLPRPEIVARWRRVTGARFRFAVKMWRRITHDRKLANCRAELESFLAVPAELGPRCGPLLVQLPPSLHEDAARLDGFLALLSEVGSAVRNGGSTRKARASRRTGWRVAVEFRHPSWLCAEVLEVLTRHGAALCLADLPRCPITEPNDAPFVYMRRHGPAGGYCGCYTPVQIAVDAERVREWIAAGRDVCVYYNNDVDGHAVENARQLTQALRP